MAATSIVWTGKNLAEVRRFHKQVAHYPRAEGDDSYRDPSQHPDNLHLTREDGTTLVAAPGDTITRGLDGLLAVVEGQGRRPTATGRFGGGRTIEVTQHSSPARSRKKADDE